jgi:hypothetical protein
MKLYTADSENKITCVTRQQQRHVLQQERIITIRRSAQTPSKTLTANKLPT